MLSSRWLFWWLYALFTACAVGQGWHADLLAFPGALGTAKALLLVAYVAFLAYSVYCTTQENLFRSVAVIGRLHWGRQIGADLYLGLALALSLIYLQQGAWVALLWLLPVLLFANLAVLVYVLVNFEAIVAMVARFAPA